MRICFFFFQAEDGIRDIGVTGVQTCALPISAARWEALPTSAPSRGSPRALPASLQGPTASLRVVGGREVLLFVVGAVPQVRGEPALGLRERPALPPRVVLDLVAADPPQQEVAGLRVGEVEAADRGAGPHGHALGERDAGGRLDVEQLPDGALLGVLRAGGVAGRGAGAAVTLGAPRVVVRGRT